MKEADSLLERAKMGIEAERFLASGVGRYLVERANNDANLAVEALKTVNPDDPCRVRELQSDLNVPDKIVHWLAEMVSEGNACEFQLKEMEDE
jgi:hypothetical protein